MNLGLTRGGIKLLLVRNSPKLCGGCCMLPVFSSLFQVSTTLSKHAKMKKKSNIKLLFVHIRLWTLLVASQRPRRRKESPICENEKSSSVVVIEN